MFVVFVVGQRSNQYFISYLCLFKFFFHSWYCYKVRQKNHGDCLSQCQWNDFMLEIWPGHFSGIVNPQDRTLTFLSIHPVLFNGPLYVLTHFHILEQVFNWLLLLVWSIFYVKESISQEQRKESIRTRRMHTAK